MPGKNKQTQKQKSKSRATKVVAVRRPRVRGRGNYFTDAVNGIKGAFRDPIGAATGIINTLNENERPDASNTNRAFNTIGRTIGDKFGIGKQLGNAGSWLSRVFGFGKYTVKSNSLVSGWGRGVHEGMNCGAPPTFSNPKSGSDVVIAHTEFISEVYSSVDFATTTFAINPGNPLLFPWFSNIAKLYEEYEILGLLFEYKTTMGSGTNSAVPQIGTVAMATDYDVYDSNYTSMTSLLNAEFASSSVADSNFLHPVECDPKRNVLRSLYVQPGATTATVSQGDARFSFMANTTVATEGQAAAGVRIGKLYVTYHIRLSRPMLETTISDFTQRVEGPIFGDGSFTIGSTKSWGGTGFTPTIVGSGSSSKLKLANVAGLRGTFMVTLVINLVDAASSEPWFTGASYATYNPPAMDEVLYNSSSHDRIAYGQGISKTLTHEYSDYNQYLSHYIFTANGDVTGFGVFPLSHIATESHYCNVVITSIAPEAVIHTTSLEKTDSRIERLERQINMLSSSNNSTPQQKTSKNEITELANQVESLTRKLKQIEEQDDDNVVHVNTTHFRNLKQ